MLAVRDYLNLAEHRLQDGPHPDRARQDAEALLRHVLQKDRAWLLAHRDDKILPEERHLLTALLDRRAEGEPMQYITGQVEFYGLPFHVEPGVLIPRPETEHLVEEVLRLAAHFPSPRIADIGTGSGAIAVALAHALPNAQITASDLSPQALTIARRNAELNAVHIEFVEGDLLARLAGRSFDILVSNPPYVPEAERASLSIEVREHEPASALFAGDDGLSIYRRLIPDALAHLNPRGFLVLEIGHGQQPAIGSLLTASGYQEIYFLPDYQGIPRVACAQRP